MKRFTRLSLVVAALCLGLVGFVYGDPELAEGLGLDFWNHSQFDRQLTDSRKLRSRLELQQEQLSWRIDYRASLIADLQAGRTSVEQVIRQFQSLNVNNNPGPEFLRYAFESEDDRTVAAWQLVRFLETEERDNPADFKKLRAEVAAIAARDYPRNK